MGCPSPGGTEGRCGIQICAGCLGKGCVQTLFFLIFPPVLQPLEEGIGALLEGGLWSAKTFDFSQNARDFQSTSLVLVLLLARLYP